MNQLVTITILDLAKKIHKLRGKSFNPSFLPPRDYDTKKRQPDIVKIKTLFSDYKFISINEGLIKLDE